MNRVDREARAQRKQATRRVVRTDTLKKTATGERHTTVRTVERSVERAEASALIREMSRVYLGTIKFYKSKYAGELSHADAVEKAASMNKWRREKVDASLPERISWTEISAVAEASMEEGLIVWGKVREAADDELESGRRAAGVTGDQSDPYTIAQFLAIRDSIADQWQPRAGIESAMVDMLAVSFSLYLYWSEIAHKRAVHDHEEQRKEIERLESKGWRSPYQWQADAIEQAHRLADGYNRQFLRVLRQLRDLRRYAPVVIQNHGGQINVGTQQVNMKS
jgi:hypothetical protein